VLEIRINTNFAFRGTTLRPVMPTIRVMISNAEMVSRGLPQARRVVRRWYLMVPPLAPDGKQIDTTAKLSQWALSLAFDRLDDCTNTLDALMKRAATHAAHLNVLQVEHSRCISTDDPRLKSK
jgi:hypothetical protein